MYKSGLKDDVLEAGKMCMDLRDFTGYITMAKNLGKGKNLSKTTGLLGDFWYAVVSTYSTKSGNISELMAA